MSILDEKAKELSLFLEIIRKAPIEELLNRTTLEKLILKLGVGDYPNRQGYPFDYTLGVNLKCLQNEKQLAPLLIYLFDKGITSYLEIGVGQGGTLILISEYLNRFNALKTIAAVDFLEKPWLLALYNVLRRVKFQQTTTDNLRLSDNYDLIMVDADHSYEFVMRDFEKVKNHGRYILFHDIADDSQPGVRQAWLEIKQGYRYMEFVDQYPGMTQSYMGLGLIEV